MKLMFSTMLAFALCLMWVPPASASQSVSKTELKQCVCSMPVMVFEYSQADVLKSVELDINSPEGSFANEYDRSPVIVMGKCRLRFSQGRNLTKSALNQSYRPFQLIPKMEHVSASRLYSLRC